MANYRVDSEEEALFRSYPYPIYYVQSPSTLSNNELECCQSPIQSEPFMNKKNTIVQEDNNTLTLSRYSSSRESTNSFLHDKKGSYDVQSHGTGITLEEINGRDRRNGRHYEDEEEEEEEEEYDEGNRTGWFRVLVFGESSSFGWNCLQITWRFMVSMAIALTVFYIATKPPPPKVSIKVC